MEVLVLGTVLLFTRRWRRAGRRLVVAGVGGLILFSMGPFSSWLLLPLEGRYPPLHDSQALPEAERIQYVVVLGGGHIADPNLPATSQLNPTTLTRLVEGIRLYRQAAGRRLVVSGGRVFGPAANAELMAEIARGLGVPDEDLVVEAVARDTESEARELADMLGQEPFIMVTAASHMPRAVALFRKRGLHPIPAPAPFRYRRAQGWSPGALFPHHARLGNARRAVYEYLGLAWGWLRGAL
jgi:uncharacterized SAM-binding protein YcdF (DUF218 family)